MNTYATTNPEEIIEFDGDLETNDQAPESSKDPNAPPCKPIKIFNASYQ